MRLRPLGINWEFPIVELRVWRVIGLNYVIRTVCNFVVLKLFFFFLFFLETISKGGKPIENFFFNCWGEANNPNNPSLHPDAINILYINFFIAKHMLLQLQLRTKFLCQKDFHNAFNMFRLPRYRWYFQDTTICRKYWA